MSDSITTAYTDAARHALREAHEKIVHCVDQLGDEQVNWRPFEQQNSIANVILHLCGNLRQWAVNGIEQLPDMRHRASEFSDRRTYTRADLLARLAEVARDADAAIGRITDQTITQPRRIQAHDKNVLSAIFDTVSHFVGHSHEIVYITRFLLREKYKFKFVPTKEQGGE